MTVESSEQAADCQGRDALTVWMTESAAERVEERWLCRWSAGWWRQRRSRFHASQLTCRVDPWTWKPVTV